MLHGKNLMCWCALDQPCHADILLERQMDLTDWQIEHLEALNQNEHLTHVRARYHLLR